MTRVTTTIIDAGIAAHIAAPSYLVACLLDTPLYWTTMDEVDWDGQSWVATGLQVLSISETAARIRVRNDDNTGSALVLNNVLRDTEFRIYAYYPADAAVGGEWEVVGGTPLEDVDSGILEFVGGAGGDAIEVFRGYGGGAVVETMHATIDLRANKAANTLAPRGRIAAPVFSYLPKLGAVINWGGDQLKVTF